MFLLVLAYPGSPGQRLLNGCVYVCVCTMQAINSNDLKKMCEASNDVFYARKFHTVHNVFGIML